MAQQQLDRMTSVSGEIEQMNAASDEHGPHEGSQSTVDASHMSVSKYEPAVETGTLEESFSEPGSEHNHSAEVEATNAASGIPCNSKYGMVRGDNTSFESTSETDKVEDRTNDQVVIKNLKVELNDCMLEVDDTADDPPEESTLGEKFADLKSELAQGVDSTEDVPRLGVRKEKLVKYESVTHNAAFARFAATMRAEK